MSKTEFQPGGSQCPVEDAKVSEIIPGETCRGSRFEVLWSDSREGVPKLNCKN